MIFFRVSDLSKAGTEAAVDEDEVLEPKVFTIDEALALAETGELIDMKTAFGLRLLRESRLQS